MKLKIGTKLMKLKIVTIDQTLGISHEYAFLRGVAPTLIFVY